MGSSAKVTIRDVAKQAGCGVATASRVLNKSGPASREVTQRVEAAAQELGFSFSAIGRALQSKRSMTIGCVVPSLANPVFAEAVQGIQNRLYQTEYQILIASTDYDAAADSRAINRLIANRVDGMIATMIAPGQSDALVRARAHGIPVSLMFHDPIEGLVSAHVDNFEAARGVAHRFARFGHQRCGFLALKFSTSDRSRNRYAGFHQGCRDCGLGDPLLIEIGEAEARNPDELASVLQARQDLTAIFASNDFLAISVQRSARLLGWAVPRDLSVVGFDGIDVGLLLDPPLTTVETDPQAIGRQAADTLLAMLQGEAPAQAAPLPFSFREGGTLAGPRTESRDDDCAATQSPSVPPLKTKPNRG